MDEREKEIREEIWAAERTEMLLWDNAEGKVINSDFGITDFHIASAQTDVVRMKYDELERYTRRKDEDDRRNIERMERCGPSCSCKQAYRMSGDLARDTSRCRQFYGA